MLLRLASFTDREQAGVTVLLPGERAAFPKARSDLARELLREARTAALGALDARNAVALPAHALVRRLVRVAVDLCLALLVAQRAARVIVEHANDTAAVAALRDPANAGAGAVVGPRLIGDDLDRRGLGTPVSVRPRRWPRNEY